jgi:hypothetical protein
MPRVPTAGVGVASHHASPKDRDMADHAPAGTPPTCQICGEPEVKAVDGRWACVNCDDPDMTAAEAEVHNAMLVRDVLGLTVH